MQTVTSARHLSTWQGPAAAGLAVLLWALVPLLAGLAEALPPLRLACLALLGGALATLPMARGRPQEPPLSGGSWWWVHLGVPLLIVGAVGACFAALRLAPVAEAALITYTWPLLFLLASEWLTRRRLRPATLGGSALAFAGAALLVAPEALAGGLSGAWGGYLLALLTAFCWALYSLVCGRPGLGLRRRLPRLLLIASLITGAASLGVEGRISAPDAQALLAAAALGLGPYGLAMLAWERALQDPRGRRLGNLAHGVPVLASLFLVMAGMTTADWRLPVAAALVMAGSLAASR
ncbi:EamA family transporter [Halomonas salifodinae]|uniref:EamA family transporter n=1 Tax=Halomonas salifodinae TaxID=438745 RepID=A0ABW2EQP9_9GAMM